MKKALFLLFLCCCTLTGFAQLNNPFRFGVTGGMNVSNITDAEADCRIGFNAGIKMDYFFSQAFYATSAVLVTQKGCEYDDDDVTFKANPLYLQLPIYAGYRFNINDGISLFGEAGPYLAYGIAGKIKASAGRMNESVDFFDEEGVKDFEMGLGLRFGLEYQKFQIHLGYEYGLTKVIKDGSNHNSNFNVGVTYMF